MKKREGRYMKSTISLFLCVALLSCSPTAEMTQQSQTGHSDQVGTITMTSGFARFSEIGTVHGEFNTYAGIKVRDFVDSGSGEKLLEIIVEIVGPNGRRTQTSISGSAIDMIINVLKEYSSFDPTEAGPGGFAKSHQIVSDGHERNPLTLSISTNQEQEKVSFLLQTRIPGQTAYLDFSDIEEFMNLIKQAKQEIDSLR